MTSGIDETKPASGSASTANVRANFSAAKDEINLVLRSSVDLVTATGSGDALVANYSIAPTLVEGLRILLVSPGTNTVTTPTLNVNSTGAKTIVQMDGTAIDVGNIVSGGYYDFVYDATATKWVLLNPTVVDVAHSVSSDSATSATNSTQLNGQAASYYTNAGNLSSGTIPSARLSASDILTLIKTVDGSGSGLDADVLDGQSSAYYLAYSNFTGTVPAADLPAGTTTAKGAVELATDTEAYGTSDSVVITPGNLASIFANSRASNGYQKIRGTNGIIVQWGSVSVASDSSASVTFPTPFPIACRAVNVTVGEANNFDVNAPGISTPSASGVTIYNKGSGGRTVTMYWIAIGY